MKFFESFIQLHTIFRLFRNELSMKGDVSESSIIFNFRLDKEQGINWFDISVLAEMENGDDLDWYYEMWWGNLWIIKRSVNKREGQRDGSDTLLEFSDIECVTLDTVCIQMLICAEELLQWKHIEEGTKPFKPI